MCFCGTNFNPVLLVWFSLFFQLSGGGWSSCGSRYMFCCLERVEKKEKYFKLITGQTDCHKKVEVYEYKLEMDYKNLTITNLE